MTWLNRFRNFILPPRVVEHVAPLYLKRGKWVIYDKKIAIITDISNAGRAIIDFIGEDGLTLSRAIVPINDLRIALWIEIPASRRPSVEAGRARGYL